jgi:hypothetical protein
MLIRIFENYGRVVFVLYYMEFTRTGRILSEIKLGIVT